MPWRKGLLYGIILFFAAGFIWGIQKLEIDVLLHELLAQVEAMGIWGPAIFILFYVAACVLFLPGSLLTLGGGFLFGVIKGTLYVSVAATLGAVISFVIGRYFMRGWVSRKINQHPKFKAVDEAVGREGWKIVFLTRLSPVFPFNFLNYAFGLTSVSLSQYTLASWIGMLPGTLMYVYLGSLAGNLAALGEGQAQRTPQEWVFFTLGLLATVAVTLYVTRIARKALSGKVEEIL